MSDAISLDSDQFALWLRKQGVPEKDISAEEPSAEEREAEARWQAVYDARSRVYERLFGPFPEEVKKLQSLIGVWPGGCLIQIERSKVRGFCATSSFGLSNADMPASTSSEDVEFHDDGDRASRMSMRLVGREPRAVAAGLAGYGYEVLLLTRQQDFFPLMFLNTIVQMEIQRDCDLLDQVDEIGGVTVEAVRIDDDATHDFLISPAEGGIPATANLPNGTMHFLVATAITRPEMEFALAKGQRALVERLAKAGVGQVSDLARKSIV